MKLFGKNNDLRTEEGRITKLGYEVMLLSSVFGLCVFLTGRYLYGKSLREKQSDEIDLRLKEAEQNAEQTDIRFSSKDVLTAMQEAIGESDRV